MAEFPNCRPFFKGYELLGASQMVRLAIQFDLGPHNVGAAKRMGLCISGLTVEGLIKEVEQADQIDEKVIVLIGTNDILKAGRSPSPRTFLRTLRGFLERLRKVLADRCGQVVFLTVPLVPRLLKILPESRRWVERVNAQIQSWDNGATIIVIPAHQLWMLHNGNPDLALFERFMGAGKNKRTDLIDFNKGFF